MILTFGKHNGKSITDLLNEEEYSYIIWLSDNVSYVNIDIEIYNLCKNEIFKDLTEYEVIMESRHGDYGCRD